MEYATRTTSVPCKCGGRHQKVPSIETQHRNTKKHINYVFERLTERLLDPAYKDKVTILKQLNWLIRTGKVKM